ncbi:fibronectin type III domain-containing protein [Nesterenkonia sp. K-15-9-6]|uniref:fibronectin type III domain-containing protein n=1 Tax=Nesterenkonia sp. K-15-9-6 TaxID=3093918 RepID=UPI0040448203
MSSASTPRPRPLGRTSTRGRRRSALATAAALALLAPLGVASSTAASTATNTATTSPASAIQPADGIPPGEVLAFDFGCAGGPVAEGHHEVTESTLYDAESGFGLSAPVACRDRGAPDAMRRDFVLAGGEQFQVDLPDGEYHVTVISGDEIASNNTQLTVQGEFQGSLSPRGSGEYAEHSVYTEVTDGSLVLEVFGDGRFNGVEISQVAPPTGLEAAEVSTEPPSATLAWDEAIGAAAYTLYRSAHGEQDFQAVGSTEGTSLLDEDVELGYSYDYAVTQTSAAGAESGHSEVLTVSIVDPEVAAPSAPQDLALEKANPSRTTISWTGDDAADEYHVYRSLNADRGFERIAETTDTTHTSPGEAEHNWYYTVLAVNPGGVSERPDPLLAPVTARGDNGNPFEECTTDGADAVVTRHGDTWRAVNDGETVLETYAMVEAMQAAVDSLTEGRTEQESVVVRGSGTMTADAAVDLPSHTSFSVCGTIHVAGNESNFSYEDHTGVVRIRHAEDVAVPFLSVTGNPNFGVYLRTSSDVHFGQMDLRLSGGHGMRIDSRDDDSVREARDITIDDVYVSGTQTHGVETYGVDGLTIGTVTAVDTGHAGLLLNDTVNADIERIVGDGAAAGTGYATFRTANRNGQIDGEYPTNIRVGELIADGGGRGFFCVSESGGVEIETLEIRDTGSNAMLIENCHNITVASEEGYVSGPGDLRISARSEFANTSDIRFANLTLEDTAINESPCGENITAENITLIDSELNLCE